MFLLNEVYEGVNFEMEWNVLFVDFFIVVCFVCIMNNVECWDVFLVGFLKGWMKERIGFGFWLFVGDVVWCGFVE